ncbi:MAG TPA: glycosyltransferase family A protein [Candidatus Binatia bacterium]|jgi:glycosyltransferase involved in cell wall biosynthesis
MKLPLISCIVPVFNGERYLRETLDSILAQTYRPLEVVVIDDGSTDGTSAIVADYGVQVRYLWQANSGPATARNLGLSAARGDYVAFLDADDLWHPEKLARQMARFGTRPEIDLCFSRFENFWMPELAEEEARYQRHPLSHPQSAWSICTLLAQRAVFESFGKFQEGARELENMPWFLHAAAQGAVVEILSDILMYRRLHPENSTRKSRPNILNSVLPLLRDWRNFQRRRSDG